MKVDTLDNMFAKFGVPKFVKIDVEGYELEVLKGLSEPVKISLLNSQLKISKQSFHCLNYLDKFSYIFRYKIFFQRMGESFTFE